MIRRFQRYELKYLLKEGARAALVADLKRYLAPDAHGDRDGSYSVVSLYYDSPRLDCFWNKVEGLKFRRKLRIRVYPRDDIDRVDAALVEIKERINRTVNKRRLQLPLAAAEALCAGGDPPEGLDAADHLVAQEVHYLARALQLRPTAITAYRRQAFAGDHYSPGVRVTFDTNLGGRCRGLEITARAENFLFAPRDWCIMEVKVNDTAPDWLVLLLGRHQCRLQRISKYCAVVARGLGPLQQQDTFLPQEWRPAHGARSGSCG